MTPATVFHEVTRRRPGPRPADRPAPAPAAGRLPAFIGGPSDAADRLASTSVLLVGAGSVGARIGEHLGRLGVGEVAVVDPKRFGPGLGTQAIEPADVGRPKASTVAARIKRISPRTRARWHGGRIQDLPVGALVGFDLVCASTDNLMAELEVGRVARLLGAPLAVGAVHGESLTAQVRVLRNRPDGPCLACTFGDGEWDALATEEARYSCAPDPDGLPPGAAATMSVGALCSIAADLVVLQAVCLTLGLGAPAWDTLLEYNGHRHATARAAIEVDPACRGEHRVLRRVEIDRPLPACSLAACAEAAGHAGDPDLAYGVDGLVFCQRLACPRCGAERGLGELCPPDRGRRGRCPGCGRTTRLAAHPFHSFDPVPASVLGPAARRPLRLVGGRRATAVTVHAADELTLVRFGAASRRTRP